MPVRMTHIKTSYENNVGEICATRRVAARAFAARTGKLTGCDWAHAGADPILARLEVETLLGNDGLEQIAKPSMPRVGIIAPVPDYLLFEEWHIEWDFKGPHPEPPSINGNEPRRDHGHQVCPADRVQG